MNTFTVCVISSHPIVAAGIRTLLLEHPDCAQCRCVPEPDDAEVVIYDAFNLAIADHHIRELDHVIAARPGRVLVLSRLLQPGLTARALAAGAAAAISISADADELVALIEATANGALMNDADLALENLARHTAKLRADVGLTPRQQTVLALIAAGYSNQEIATDLFITVNTVKTTIRGVYSRLRVTSRAQAVAWAIERGYAPPLTGIEQKRAPHSDRPPSVRGRSSRERVTEAARPSPAYSFAQPSNLR